MHVFLRGSRSPTEIKEHHNIIFYKISHLKQVTYDRTYRLCQHARSLSCKNIWGSGCDHLAGPSILHQLLILST